MIKNSYVELVMMLKNMDNKQLMELFADIDDVYVVDNIANRAFEFVDNSPVIDEASVIDGKLSEVCEIDEWVVIDNKQRLSE